jgi:hypothetical protein
MPLGGLGEPGNDIVNYVYQAREHGNESYGSIKSGQFVNRLSGYLLNEDFTPLTSLLLYYPQPQL